MRSRTLHLLIAIEVFTSLTISANLAAQDANSQARTTTHHHYKLVGLGSLGGGFSSGNGLNGRGSVAGVSLLTGDTTEHAFIWNRGVMTDFGTLGGPNSDASEGPMINNRDEVVGFSDTLTLDPNAENCFGGAFGDLPTPYTCLPFVWRDGVMTALPLLGGNNGDAAAINNRGQVAGLAENATRDQTCPFLHFEPVIWEKGQVSEQLPTVLGDSDGWAGAINDKGQAVGFTGSCGPVHAVLWENGKAIDLGTLGGAMSNIAFDINNRGQVVGSSDLAGDATHHAFLWTKDDGMQDLGTLYGLPVSLAQAINNKGQVVGYSQDLNSNNTVAFLWQDGVMTDLNTLVPSNSHLRLREALGINDRGEISGYMFNTDTSVAPAFLAIPCDDDHPDVEGCDYSMVNAAEVANNAVAPRTPLVFQPAMDSLSRTINPSQNWFKQRSRIFGQRRTISH